MKHEVQKIVIDLTNWSKPYPTGAVAYSGDLAVASEYCDSVEEFMAFFEELGDNLSSDIRLDVHMDMEDIKEVPDKLTTHALQIHSAFFEVYRSV